MVALRFLMCLIKKLFAKIAQLSEEVTTMVFLQQWDHLVVVLIVVFQVVTIVVWYVCVWNEVCKVLLFVELRISSKASNELEGNCSRCPGYLYALQTMCPPPWGMKVIRLAQSLGSFRGSQGINLVPFTLVGRTHN